MPFLHCVFSNINWRDAHWYVPVYSPFCLKSELFRRIPIICKHSMYFQWNQQQIWWIQCFFAIWFKQNLDALNVKQKGKVVIIVTASNGPFKKWSVKWKKFKGNIWGLFISALCKSHWLGGCCWLNRSAKCSLCYTAMTRGLIKKDNLNGGFFKKNHLYFNPLQIPSAVDWTGAQSAH